MAAMAEEDEVVFLRETVNLLSDEEPEAVLGEGRKRCRGAQEKGVWPGGARYPVDAGQ